jgi:hypothetical protein
MDGITTYVVELPWVTKAFAITLTLVALALHTRFNEKAVSFGPTILTTTGIFATFVGITEGLAQFDTGNVEGSVPALLRGLQTAFVGSAVGVFWALTLKYRDYAFGVRVAPGVVDSTLEVTAADLVFQLKEITRALVGGEEGSLISQLKLLRQDTTDRLDALKAAQMEALAKLSEMGSKALVEALRDVIKDFNAAVGQLLVWQKQYKEQIESIVDGLGDASDAMNQATKDYSALVERSGIFTKIAEELGAMLRTLNDDRTRLQTVSAELAKLLLSAEGSLPQIEQKVAALTDQLVTAVTDNQKRVGAALTENAAALRTSMQSANETMATAQRQQVAQITEHAEKTKQQFAALTEQLATSIAESQKRVGVALTENATAVRNSIQAANEAMTSSHKQHGTQIAELVDKTKQQVTILDKALSEELEKSLNSLGRQLTALSERFVQDYGPLTEKLRRILELARV